MHNFQRLVGWLGVLREMAIGLLVVTVIGVAAALVMWLVVFAVARIMG